MTTAAERTLRDLIAENIHWLRTRPLGVDRGEVIALLEESIATSVIAGVLRDDDAFCEGRARGYHAAVTVLREHLMHYTVGGVPHTALLHAIRDVEETAKVDDTERAA